MHICVVDAITQPLINGLFVLAWFWPGVINKPKTATTGKRWSTSVLSTFIIDITILGLFVWIS
ncbi:hypothetical protein M5D96_009921 [Drosophila gunungcola]|uniref:Uncharacterized protein n=1 Tax=Drosophila gunungcola TaxID=103775 RepID=A0A9P9YHQ3_9MUSC|nr:hypothetical protein M5D96_011361 [Drosophila gunungcola]KAI8037173.1 hypothetical protein M5D96_009921 [Drosophila gunungcola]